MTKTFTCMYHILVLNWFIFLNLYISQLGRKKDGSRLFANGGQWKYLTILNLLLQNIFYGVACLDDVLKRISGRKDIKFLTAFRDLLFTALAFPISTFVFLGFWTLFHYNRELIYPRVLDSILPVWLNHAMIQSLTLPPSVECHDVTGLTATSSSWASTILLPQPPKQLGLQVPATMPGYFLVAVQLGLGLNPPPLVYGAGALLTEPQAPPL
ncbi:androgen-dependent TFPI-regulating protein isoform X3 [Nycticebus coucang]|uniref:androgen-dependent TFPI-regulating protein isoform X3 n=1 Tax=Nycticebus coucang TaxID=9470 RepID=UPI00234DDA6A|nr:androgen-dependent TFPI-regulating protein isoform X3 [Nycticebus coucang]